MEIIIEKTLIGDNYSQNNIIKHRVSCSFTQPVGIQSQLSVSRFQLANLGTSAMKGGTLHIFRYMFYPMPL